MKKGKPIQEIRKLETDPQKFVEEYGELMGTIEFTALDYANSHDWFKGQDYLEAIKHIKENLQNAKTQTQFEQLLANNLKISLGLQQGEKRTYNEFELKTVLGKIAKKIKENPNKNHVKILQLTMQQLNKEKIQKLWVKIPLISI